MSPPRTKHIFRYLARDERRHGQIELCTRRTQTRRLRRTSPTLITSCTRLSPRMLPPIMYVPFISALPLMRPSYHVCVVDVLFCW